MKKIISTITFISLIVLVIVTSCKKTETDNNKNDTNNELAFNEQIIYNKLLSFNNKIKYGYKDAVTMTLDSAEWYLESYYNVADARTEDPYKNIRKDTTYYKLPINANGLINFADMNNMYNEMLSDLDSMEVQIADPSIFPVYGMLDLISSNSTTASFMLTTGFGSNYNGNYEPFNDDDDWHWGDMKGKCDGSYMWENDGGQELKRRLNNPYFQWAGAGSFIDPKPVDAFYTEYPDDNNENPDPNVGYMIYYEENTSNSPLPCLENDEMTFYLNKAHDIIYTYNNQFLPNTTLKGKRPIGKSFMAFDIWTPSGNNNGTYWWEHRYTITYGIRINLPLPG